MERLRETLGEKELCLLGREERANGKDGDLPQSGTVHHSCHHKPFMGDSDFGPMDSDQPFLYHWFMKQKESLVYANVWVLRAVQKLASNLWVQSETCSSLSLSLTLMAESLANPKAGCYYLDQTSQAHSSLSELIRLCYIKGTSELIKTM